MPICYVTKRYLILYSDEEEGPRGGNNVDGVIPVEGINIKIFLSSFGITTPKHSKLEMSENCGKSP